MSFLDEHKAGLTIEDAIPSATPLIIQGAGALTANALIAAGQLSASMTIVEPVQGKVEPATTPEEVVKIDDPTLKLERAATPENKMGIQSPSMMNGPGGRR